MREVPPVPTNTRKYLGVQLTSNLDWVTHVEPFQPRLIGLSNYSNAISNTVLLASKRQQSKPWCDPIWTTVAPYGILTKRWCGNTRESLVQSCTLCEKRLSWKSSFSERIRDLGWHSLQERRAMSRLTLMFKLQDSAWPSRWGSIWSRQQWTCNQTIDKSAPLQQHYGKQELL